MGGWKGGGRGELMGLSRKGVEGGGGKEGFGAEEGKEGGGVFWF